MTAEDLAIYKNLRDTSCVCGANKKARQSFCRRDYFRLPRGIQEALYAQDAYPDTFRRACTQLNLVPPSPEAQCKN